MSTHSVSPPKKECLKGHLTLEDAFDCEDHSITQGVVVSCYEERSVDI